MSCESTTSVSADIISGIMPNITDDVDQNVVDDDGGGSSSVVSEHPDPAEIDDEEEEVVDETNTASSSLVAESPVPSPPLPPPQPILATIATSNSSRCTSPMSPPSDHDHNVSAATSSSNEDETMSVMNLTMNKSNKSTTTNTSNNVDDDDDDDNDDVGGGGGSNGGRDGVVGIGHHTNSNTNSSNNNHNNNNSGGAASALLSLSSSSSPSSSSIMKHQHHSTSGTKRPLPYMNLNQNHINAMLNNFDVIETLRLQQQLQQQQQYIFSQQNMNNNNNNNNKMKMSNNNSGGGGNKEYSNVPSRIISGNGAIRPSGGSTKMIRSHRHHRHKNGANHQHPHHHHHPNNNNHHHHNPLQNTSVQANSNSSQSLSSAALDGSNVTNSPDFTQLLLEYRQVLLDVLAKTLAFNDSLDDTTNNNTSTTTGAHGSSASSSPQMESIHKGIILPIKCQCGYTSELSKHITRTSTYVHQLELKFRSLLESIKISTDPNRYTPKRPWFINPPATANTPLVPAVYPFATTTTSSSSSNQAKVSSLLEKKKSSNPRISNPSMMVGDKQQQSHPAIHQQLPISLFSGNSSINSSLNGEEDDDEDDDIDSDEDDVNPDMNLSENLIYTNGVGIGIGGTIDETNHHQLKNINPHNGNNNNNNVVEGKTILEGYLESMKNVPSDDNGNGGTDEENGGGGKHNPMDDLPDVDDEDLDGGSIGEEDYHRGPGKRIDLRTKKIVVQMQRNGASFTDISRQIGISRKSVRRIISNFKAYGLLEKKRESRVQKGMQDHILRLYKQGRSYTQISRATTVSKHTIAKILKQLTDSNIFAKGPTNGLNINGGVNGAAAGGFVHNASTGVITGGGATSGAGVGQSLQDSLIDDGMLDDDMEDEEREMIVDERAIINDDVHDDAGDAGDEDEDDDDEEEEEDGEEEEEQDIDYDEDNTAQNEKNDIEPNIINSFTLYPRVNHQQQSQPHHHHHQQQQAPSQHKSKRNLSLIQGPQYNGSGGGGYTPTNKNQYQSSQTLLNGGSHNSNNSGGNRLSLIKPQHDRFKPYDLKVRANNSNNSTNESLTQIQQQQQQHHHNRMSKSHPIVPPLPASANHLLYGPTERSAAGASARMSREVKMYDNSNSISSGSSSKRDSNNNNKNQHNNNHHHHHDRRGEPRDNSNGIMSSRSDRHHRTSSKMMRHSVDMSLKDSLIMPEIADKNNNTTLNSCNMTITSGNSNNGSNGRTINDSNNNNSNNNNSNNGSASNLPPIPASLIEGNSDSDASLVPRNFIDNFPAGIMNSLNPNRATKLTLEDFNIVWQLRSQHWTHNQIRKYFQQRGKSISKSSISRIMNGKQRNFQQFFSVVPSGSSF